MLARAVDGRVRRAEQTSDRGGVDDAARVLLQHHGEHVLQAQENADHVDVDDAAEGFQRVVGDRFHLALDAGVVVENLDAAEAVGRGADITRDVVLDGDVGCDRKRFARGRKLTDHRLEILEPAIDGDDSRAPFREQAHGRSPNDAGSPGDDGRLAIQSDSVWHVISSRLVRFVPDAVRRGAPAFFGILGLSH
jgi:hypothetical protein